MSFGYFLLVIFVYVSWYVYPRVQKLIAMPEMNVFHILTFTLLSYGLSGFLMVLPTWLADYFGKDMGINFNLISTVVIVLSFLDDLFWHKMRNKV